MSSLLAWAHEFVMGLEVCGLEPRPAFQPDDFHA
jgi:hypothetical protein